MVVDFTPLGCRVEPRIERRRLPATGDDRSYQSHGDVRARRPRVDIRVVGDGCVHDLAAGARHRLQHRPAYAADGIAGGCAGRCRLDIGSGNRAADTGAADGCQIDAQGIGEAPHRR